MEMNEPEGRTFIDATHEGRVVVWSDRNDYEEGVYDVIDRHARAALDRAGYDFSHWTETIWQTTPPGWVAMAIGKRRD